MISAPESKFKFDFLCNLHLENLTILTLTKPFNKDGYQSQYGFKIIMNFEFGCIFDT